MRVPLFSRKLQAVPSGACSAACACIRKAEYVSDDRAPARERQSEALELARGNVNQPGACSAACACIRKSEYVSDDRAPARERQSEALELACGNVNQTEACMSAAQATS